MRALLLSFLLLSLSLSAGKAAGHPLWEWSPNLPSKAAVQTPPRNRDVQEVEKFFNYEMEKPADKDLPLKKLLDFLGRPDGFSNQYIYTDKRSSRLTTEGGGTFRFLLDDGGEVHAWTPDMVSVVIAVIYPKTPHFHTRLLYNSTLTTYK